MIAVTSRASAAPMRCSRLLWRVKAARSRKAASGLEGRGNQDMNAKIGLAGGIRQPWQKSAVELEPQDDHCGGGDGLSVLGCRLVAPVGNQVPPRGIEEGGIGTPERIDRNDSSATVDR